MHFIIECRNVYGLYSVVESFEIHSYALARMNFMKFIECINFIIKCRRVYGRYSIVESFESHSYALARMSFMKFIECINFIIRCRRMYGLYSNLVSSRYVLEGVITQVPQNVRTLFQSRFVSLCPWRSHNSRFNDFNLGWSLYVLEGVIKWDPTISTLVCLFMSLKES